MEDNIFTALQLFSSIIGGFIPIWIAAAAIAINRRSSRLVKRAYHEIFVVDHRGGPAPWERRVR